MTCLIDGCFGTCDTHSPKGETIWFLDDPTASWDGSKYSTYGKLTYKILDEKGLTPEDFDLNAKPSGFLPNLSAAVNKYLQHLPIAFPVKFYDWHHDFETNKIIGVLGAMPWIFESTASDEHHAVYKPYYYVAQMTLYNEDIEVFNAKPFMLYDLLAGKIKGAVDYLSVLVAEKLAAVHPPNGLEKIYTGYVPGGIEVHVPMPMNHVKWGSVTGWTK